MTKPRIKLRLQPRVVGMNALKSHLCSLGSDAVARLAAAVQSKPIYLWQLARGHRRPSPVLALSIERATARAVTRHDLRPDIYGPAPGVDPELPASQDVAA
jgi:DNA-binding transcriptional regulator YdaS (Cro superfamily)